MESELLQTLKEIKGIIFVTGVFVSVGSFFWIVRSITIIINQIKDILAKVWKSQANEYFEKGAFDNLIKHCEERKKKYPNDTHVYWWLARAYREKGEVQKANELFLTVREMEPSWEEEFVNPYISK